MKHQTIDISENNRLVEVESSTKSAIIFSREPKKALAEMKELVQMMSSQFIGTDFISNINGKQYPKVEWWTSLGATIGLFPVVVYSKRLDRKEEIAYEARVEVRFGDRVIAAGEALCTNKESNWKDSPEYSIKSMSITRATGKAYRIPLSFIAVMAGLAPTNAEEMVDIKPNKSDSLKMASEKQTKYLENLCAYKYGNQTLTIVENYLIQKYDVNSLSKLTKDQASEMIEFLIAKNDLSTSNN